MKPSATNNSVRCLKCTKTLKWNMSTSSLIKHLLTKHNIVIGSARLQPSKNSLTARLSAPEKEQEEEVDDIVAVPSTSTSVSFNQGGFS